MTIAIVINIITMITKIITLTVVIAVLVTTNDNNSNSNKRKSNNSNSNSNSNSNRNNIRAFEIGMATVIVGLTIKLATNTTNNKKQF